MIRRVKIQGYKSLKDVEVRFDMLTVIFGSNAAGKSNLFDALALLSRMATQRTLQEAFKEHRGTPLEAFFHGDEGIEALVQQGKAQFSIEVDVMLSDDVMADVEKRAKEMRKGLSDADDKTPRRVQERFLRYGVSIELQTNSGHLRVIDEHLSALNNDFSQKQSRKPFFEKAADIDKLSLRMEGQSHPSYYDIGLDHTLISVPLYAPHYPHITAFREELSRWRFYYLEPKRLMRNDNPLKEVLSLDSTGGDLAAFFHTLKIANRRQFEVVNKTIPLLLPSINRIDVERTKTGELQLKIFEKGTSFPASVVSEGTLRILGLLAITNALVPAAVVGYEEPENGIHLQRLKLIADILNNAAFITKSQYLINTHSADLLDFLTYEAHLINCRNDGAGTKFSTIPNDLFRKTSFQHGFNERYDKELTIFDEQHDRELSLSGRVRRGDYGG